MGEALMKFIATFSVNSMATVKLVPPQEFQIRRFYVPFSRIRTEYGEFQPIINLPGKCSLPYQQSREGKSWN